MWTPRRILLLIAAVVGFTAVFVVYDRFLGLIDGLPDLPVEYAEAAPNQTIEFDNGPVSPTYLRLQEAWGPNSPEVLDSIAYKIKNEQRDKGIVIASGQPTFAPEPSKFVTVSPFSVAFFGKPKPAHLRTPDDIPEISTFHADKAVLQFDREVRNVQDIGTKAKLVGMELISDPDLPSNDVRRGQIVITNNQRSRDPGQFLVFTTPGPLFYRAFDSADPPPKDAPQVWTSAPVEVVDRRNLPRALRTPVPLTSPIDADELRARGAIADILQGTTLPPPTITAVGMKIYLNSQNANTPPEKRSNTGYTGVRAIEMSENVQMNLWTDGDSGLPGSEPGAAKPPAAEPPLAAGGFAGGLIDGLAVNRTLDSKSLLVIKTLGAFHYNFETSQARFEAATAADPAAFNHVTAVRVNARGRQDDLTSQLLVIDFAEPDGKTSAPKNTQSLAIKALTATGPHVYISVEADQLTAQGTELRYTTDAKTRKSFTVLRGTPVTTLKEKNQLEAGAVGQPAEVVIVATEPPPGSKEKKTSVIEVRGPGRMAVFDEATNSNNLLASWGKSLTQEKEKVGTVDQDLLKFEGGGAFVDTKGDMKIAADSLWLWLAPGEKAAPAKPGSSTSANLPQRLLGVGDVKSTSPEMVIQKTDRLTVWFRDVPPPPPEPLAASRPEPKPISPVVPAPPTPGTPAPPDAKSQAAAEPPKPPVVLSARVIESWVVRYPVLNPIPVKKATEPVKAPAQPSLKYELERARLDDRVVVHQAPTDPAKNPRGLDVTGDVLNLTQTKAGSIMEVTAKIQAQVHFEEMSLYGPFIRIDQPGNAVAIKGRGVISMPSQTDEAGNAPQKPSRLVVFFAREMNFEGAKAKAEFYDEVQAVQEPDPDARRSIPEIAPTPRVLPVMLRQPAESGKIAPPPPEDDGSWTRTRVLCHELKVTFDRPIYFNNYKRGGGAKPAPKKPGQPAGKDEPAKLKTALCTPMPDEQANKLAPAVASLARKVIYLEQTFSKAGASLRAQKIVALQLDLKNEEREKEVIAAGPGEVRIMQPGAKDGFGPQPQKAPVPTAPAKTKAPAEEQEMKVTVVRFISQMVAKDKNKVYQEAVFDRGGGRVWQIPSDDIDLEFLEHNPPPRTIFLASTESLKVSSAKKGKDEVEQRMTAVGNGEFKTDEHEGNAHTITYDGNAVTLDGQGERLAKMSKRRTGVNNREFYNAKQIIYYRDGTIKTPGAASGAFSSGGP